MKDKKMFNRLFAYMRPYLGLYILAIILMAISVGLDVVSPYLVSLSLSELGKDPINFNIIILYFVINIILAFASSIVLYFQTMLMHKTGQKIVYQIRYDVFYHIEQLSHEQLNQIPVGTLVTRVSSDVNVLFELYTNVIINILKYAATIIAVFIAMLLINARLALIVISVFPLIAALTIVFRVLLRKVHRNVRTEVANMNAFLSENISGIKVTQIFNQEDKKLREFEETNNNLKKASIKEIFTFGIFRPLIYLIYIATVIIILYTGTNDVIKASFGAVSICITYSELYAFYQYISKFFNPIQSLADQFNTLQSAFASGEKIFNILDITPSIQDAEDAIDLDIKGDIEFRDVWFAYEAEDWVLKGVSFKIKPKEVVAFVGATGAGKSTIINLITRNYDIQKGQILIDGVDIKKIKLASLRGGIGQMLQDVFLFSGTIASNIRLNDDSITDEEIINACKEINATDLINKSEEGLNGHVGERGGNLSLGQRQLISFARTIVHKPNVMILDEATSNIDTETEKIIQNSLETLINNNTMIMVAHRLSTIQHATRIYVFDHGHIIEEGNHQELLRKKGRYYQLYMLQYQKEN